MHGLILYVDDQLGETFNVSYEAALYEDSDMTEPPLANVPLTVYKLTCIAAPPPPTQLISRGLANGKTWTATVRAINFDPELLGQITGGDPVPGSCVQNPYANGVWECDWSFPDIPKKTKAVTFSFVSTMPECSIEVVLRGPEVLIC